MGLISRVSSRTYRDTKNMNQPQLEPPPTFERVLSRLTPKNANKPYQYQPFTQIYACTFCPKTFKDKHKLKQHLDMHNNIKSYKCPECDHTTTWKHNLSRHMKIHTGEKPYTCDVCNKSFRQSTHLKKHLATSSSCNLKQNNNQKQAQI